MSKFFYVKLALNNIKRNKDTYVPYIIAGIGMIFTFLLLGSMLKNDGLSNMSGAATLNQILSLGLIVVGIFSIIFIIYANSFLLKRRKKELGLYAILGLEKKHVVRVLFYEAIFIFSVVFLGGFIFSFVFGKLSFLALLRMLKVSGTLSFSVEISTIKVTCLLFLGFYLCTFVLNSIQVKIANPIQLLRGDAEGEKIPKVSWIFTLIGVLTLGSGYYIAITTKNPLAAVLLFFIAVILVIIGTYALFTAGSIAVLKILQKKKGFYYKTNNFISVSGMIYRMKQNAAGLANICILSTMVLVMVSGTISLFLGQEKVLTDRYPMDIFVSANNKVDQDNLNNIVENIADKYDLEVTDRFHYYAFNGYGIWENGKIIGSDFYSVSSLGDISKTVDLQIITLAEYNRVAKREIILGKDEVLINQKSGKYEEDVIALGENKYTIKGEFKEVFIGDNGGSINDSITLIVKDEDMLRDIIDNMFQKDTDLRYYYYYDTNGETGQKINFATEVKETVRETYSETYVDSLEINREDWYSMFGGLLYLGIFLGIVFMMATVLIIYFKQISEGMVDRKRFIIMQKVGMSDIEVRKTIKKQILMVFFLPLLTAILHVSFAFPMITRLLRIFGLTNTLHVFLCTAGCIAIFVLFYTIVYSLTAKVYYKLVQQ